MHAHPFASHAYTIAGRILACLLLAGALSLIASDAIAHDAKPTAAKPQGWAYPFACCANSIAARRRRVRCWSVRKAM